MKGIGADRKKGRASEKYVEKTRISLYGGVRKQRSRKVEK